MDLNNKYRKLGFNSIFVFIGNVGGKAISLLMLPFYTRWLSVDDYGTVDLITGYSVTLYDVLTLCICSAIFIYPKDATKPKKISYFSSGLVYSVCIICVLLIIFFFLVNLLVNIDNVLRKHFVLIAIMSIASFVQNYMQNFVRSIGLMKIYSFIGIIYAFSTALFSFVFIPRWGVVGYVTAMTISAFNASVYTFFAGKLHEYLSLRYFFRKDYIEMLRYSAPLILNIFIAFILNFANRPIIENLLGLQAVGVFSVANKFPALISIFIPIFNLAFQVSVLEEYRKPDYVIFYNNVLKTTTLILTSLGILLIPLYSDIMLYFVSEDYHSSWIYVPIMTLSTIYYYIGYYHGTNFSAIKKSKYFVYSGIISSTLSFVINYILIMNFKLWGAVFAMLISSIIFSFSRYYFSRRVVKMTDLKHYILMFILYIATTTLAINVSSSLLVWGMSILSVIILMINNRSVLFKLYKLK